MPQGSRLQVFNFTLSVGRRLVNTCSSVDRTQGQDATKNSGLTAADLGDQNFPEWKGEHPLEISKHKPLKNSTVSGAEAAYRARVADAVYIETLIRGASWKPRASPDAVSFALAAC